MSTLARAVILARAASHTLMQKGGAEMIEKMRAQDEGFTLIELLVVIAILAVLVSVVAVNVTGLMGGVNETALRMETDLVQIAVDKYNTWDVAVNGSPPIPDIAGWRKAAPGDPEAPFARYLSRPTQYYYSWNGGGVELVSKLSR